MQALVIREATRGAARTLAATTDEAEGRHTTGASGIL